MHRACLAFRRGYLTPLVLIALALITLFVAATLFLHKLLISDVKKEPVPSPSPTSSATPSPKSTSDETTNWKTYTNTEYGYKISYPQNWFIQNPYGETASGNCIDSETSNKIVVFSRIKLTYCGFVGEQLPPTEADMTILVLEERWPDVVGTILGEPDAKIMLAGEKAAKYKFTEKSQLPDIQATRIYFNHNDKGYLIFLKQIDRLGTYNQIYDQILSTFQFIN